ncbi:flourescent in blue light protein [Klebsormidium nitens]|uniref:Flourescent in blue light protein n=1 Tax=Klebsormidium nitens TaxID=105231 RepID=A0A0U9HKB7_KLENI|nr:flourescent in blue light protein [Klebsormidium nitens]|eukprot:GAQ86654.1 flourescent in blue light protein [Klebsormidium nitens]
MKGPLQAMEQSGAPARPLWLRAVPLAVIGACCLCAGAAYAVMPPQDCAALLPAEEALDEAFGIDANANTVVLVASVLEAVALIGAVVGGVSARNRKEETDRLNQQLRQINLQLRRQARVESYAPGLSYAPVSVVSGNALVADPAPVNGVSHEQADLLKRLKTGKKWLREQRPALALEEFKIALALARQSQDANCEKKAARGLGASCQRLGRYKEAIGYHEIVLKTSERAGDTSGDSEAYGAIADCYTELGDLEKAGKYYDQYISRLQTTESVDLDI